MSLNVIEEHGPIKLSTFLINYHVGDIVDIKANAAQQKGMPHKYYHGFVSERIPRVDAIF
jgi:ribosomal protein L21E